MDKISSEFEFVPYSPDMKQQWDEFVARSRNATFLFKRDYMDYHSDRFEDASLIALKRGKPVALLPACRLTDGTLSSHAGLTYGSWLLPPSHLDGAAFLDLMHAWIEQCKGRYSAIIYKPIPYIYHHKPSQEDIYALWRCGFSLTSVQLSSAIDLRSDWKFNMTKRQQLRAALKYDLSIGESDDFDTFWQILNTCLSERHDARPVHSLNEIVALKESFPKQIKLYLLSDDQGPQAGVCIYFTDTVAHAQYTATTPVARQRYYLAALYDYILHSQCGRHTFFDFGTSNEDAGHYLNTGLLNQKFSMGGTGVVYETYRLQL